MKVGLEGYTLQGHVFVMKLSYPSSFAFVTSMAIIKLLTISIFHIYVHVICFHCSFLELTIIASETYLFLLFTNLLKMKLLLITNYGYFLEHAFLLFTN